jgi:ATP-dependent helicase HrpA
VAALVEDCRAAVVREAVDAAEPVRDQAAYDALAGGIRLDDALPEVLALVIRVLDAWRAADRLLGGRADMTMLPALTDMKAQLGRLVTDGFIAEAGPTQLARYSVYLRALSDRRTRLDEGGAAVVRDRQQMDRITDLQEAYLHQVAALPPGRPAGERLRRVRWMLEEYRVSLWAQQLGTPYPVSDQRIRKALAAT